MMLNLGHGLRFQGTYRLSDIEDFVTEATSQCWSVGKEVAIPLEIRLIVQRVRVPHG